MKKWLFRFKFVSLLIKMKAKELHNSIISKISHLYDDQRELDSISYLILEYFKITKTQVVLDEVVQNVNVVPITDRLKKSEPIQHILGYTWFYGKKFKANKHTLIPRPETEELCSMIINTMKGKEFNLLDIGTGTGCIPITVKREEPLCKAEGLDISQKALKVARINGINHDISVKWHLANVLEDEFDYSKYDVIVSNPPYIAGNEKEQISDNVIKYEPHQALFVENNEPLLFYKKIVDIAKNNANINHLFLEINEYYGEKTVDLIRNELGFEVELHKDMQGKDRMIHAYKK